LLGAGSSISSGIQSAYDCIWEWKKDIYLSKNINSAEFYKNYKYLALIEGDLNYAWQNSRDQYGFITHSWTPDPIELKKPKWLLDEGCIAELYARLSMLKKPAETNSGKKL